MTDAETLKIALAYADHQSWRCQYPPHFYISDPRGVPKHDCPCGLNAFLRELGRPLA